MTESDGTADAYLVIINAEEQYSIWPSHRPVPAGWRKAPQAGSRAECLEYVERVWLDMRPLSVRARMEKNRRAGPTN